MTIHSRHLEYSGARMAYNGDAHHGRHAPEHIGHPRANVNLSEIQAQAELLEEQSQQDHEESQRMTEQHLRQLCDTKSVRVTHACEHCRQRKAKCSGLQPCTRCTKQNRLCTFSKAERKGKIAASMHDLLGPHYATSAQEMQGSHKSMAVHRLRSTPTNLVMRTASSYRHAGAPYTYFPTHTVVDPPRNWPSGSWTDEESSSVQASASPQYSSAMHGSPSPTNNHLINSLPTSPAQPTAEYDDSWRRSTQIQNRSPLTIAPGPNPAFVSRSSLSQVWSNPADQDSAPTSPW